MYTENDLHDKKHKNPEPVAARTSGGAYLQCKYLLKTENGEGYTATGISLRCTVIVASIFNYDMDHLRRSNGGGHLQHGHTTVRRL